MPSEIHYHKSTENIDDAENANIKPLSVTYRRQFTLLERVLMVAVCVFVVLAIVFGILYAASETSENGPKNTVCITAECVKASAGILNSLDWSVDPCHDFYNFSCNTWLSDHAIPRSKNQVTLFSQVEEENFNFLREKLQDKETIKKYQSIDAVAKALNEYSACMTYGDVTESTKREQTREFISEFGGWNITNSGWSNSTWKLLPSLVKIHRDLSISPLFFVSVIEDIKNSSRHQIVMIQRSSYYLRRRWFLDNDTFSKKARKSYQDLMLTVMTTMANTSKEDPVVGKQVKEIYQFEKRLAEISMPHGRALMREAIYNPITIKELQEATGDTLNWLEYFQELFRDTDVAITMETRVNVNQLEYIKNMSQMLRITDDVVLANYMMWEVICSTYNYFPRIIKERFDEYKSFLYSFGTRQKPERWVSCLSLVRSRLGLPLSMLYLDDKFGEDKLKHIKEMVARIRTVYISDMETISWMDPETKRMALKKARKIKENVGFPKILLDKNELNKRYAELEIKKDDHFGNSLRKRKFFMKKTLENLPKPVDKNDWSLNAFDSNAYYARTENKIVVPAGILQPPFYDISRPMSLNYGGIGMIIGHELTHSFDNNGRQYDEHGNNFNWWKASSLMKFKNKTACMAKKYSQYSYFGLKMNGETTNDENIADNGGIKQAFQAYQTWSKLHDEPILPALNLTNNQLFFIGTAQIWCSKYRYFLRNSISQGKHSPGMIRVLGTLSNYPEFSKAFNCPLGSRMNSEKKCNIW